MRHQKKTLKLGRTAEHRKALLANQVCSLIEHQRIKTTLAKAKAVRPLAEKMVTLGKNGSLHARRTALAVLRQKNAKALAVDRLSAVAQAVALRQMFQGGREPSLRPLRKIKARTWIGHPAGHRPL